VSNLAIVVALVVLFLVVLSLRWRRPSPAATEPEPVEPPEDDHSDSGVFEALLGTVVLLDGNDWNACTIDGIEEDWRRFTPEPTRGLCALPAGRHRVSTRVGTSSAVLDFVIYPGEVLWWRLDRAQACWVPGNATELAEARRVAEGGARGALSEALISYRTTLGIARAMTGTLTAPDKAVDKAQRALETLLERAVQGEDNAPLLREAELAGLDLIGIPLTRSMLRRLGDAAQTKGGSTAMRIGLAMLPGDPRLLVLLAQALTREGDSDGAGRAMDDARLRPGLSLPLDD
jgi:hypothetical protein